MTTYTVGEHTLTRVPYFDVALDAATIGFTPAAVRDTPWGTSIWATDDGQILVGQAVWVVRSADRTIVVDPCGAADDFLRSGPEAATHEAAVVDALASAGIPVAGVDTVVMSHLDGIGMVASVNGPGEWQPLFPNARIVVSDREIEYVEAGNPALGSDAFRSLLAQGCVDGIGPAAHELAPGITLEWTGGHSVGHSVLRVGDGAVFLGHLLVNPIQVTGGVMPDQHVDAAVAFAALERELRWAQERDALVIGPLWPAPGAGRAAGPPWSIPPA